MPPSSVLNKDCQTDPYMRVYFLLLSSYSGSFNRKWWVWCPRICFFQNLNPQIAVVCLPWCLFSYDFPLNQSRACIVHTVQVWNVSISLLCFLAGWLAGCTVSQGQVKHGAIASQLHTSLDLIGSHLSSLSIKVSVLLIIVFVLVHQFLFLWPFFSWPTMKTMMNTMDQWNLLPTFYFNTAFKMLQQIQQCRVGFGMSCEVWLCHWLCLNASSDSLVLVCCD